MLGKFKVITLCGNHELIDEFFQQQNRLTLEGNIVLSIIPFVNLVDKSQLIKNKKMLMAMHKQKIDLADEVLVINKGGHIGPDTKEEIEYAMKQNKPIIYLE